MPRKSKSADALYTLTEVAKKTGISMPTLQRYKRLYQERIPSEGEGRKQRYPHSSLKVFNEIKKENIGRRGRPRKAAEGRKPTSQGRKPKASTRKATKSAKSTKAAKPVAEETQSGLLTLTEISRRTGISYPTLTRYAQKFSDQLKSEGVGRARRFYEEAVAVFQDLRSKSRRGGGRKAASTKAGGRKAATARKSSRKEASAGDAAMEARIAALEKQLKALEKKLSKPVRFTVLSS
jgi:predicted DNA-binding transcriptional regulator AlpA